VNQTFPTNQQSIRDQQRCAGKNSRAVLRFDDYMGPPFRDELNSSPPNNSGTPMPPEHLICVVSLSCAIFTGCIFPKRLGAKLLVEVASIVLTRTCSWFFLWFFLPWLAVFRFLCRHWIGVQELRDDYVQNSRILNFPRVALSHPMDTLAPRQPYSSLTRRDPSCRASPPGARLHAGAEKFFFPHAYDCVFLEIANWRAPCRRAPQPAPHQFPVIRSSKEDPMRRQHPP